MDKNSSEKLLNVINGILSDYASTCGVEPFCGNVVIADDMADAYKKIRNDLVEKGKINLNELNKYHGLTVQPLENDGKFTILLNREYVLETVTQNNVDWTGTLVHEQHTSMILRIISKLFNPNLMTSCTNMIYIGFFFIGQNFTLEQ